jgi:hypothetical protein
MPEIAYTTFGRNALVAGLTGHVAAILAGMMSASGTDIFFKVVYPFSCLAFMVGAYAELLHRGAHPFSTWRFYLIAMACVFPVLGPLIVFGLIYSFPRDDAKAQGNLAGLFPAILKLRANALMVFVLLIVLFFLFAVISGKNDPYFKRRVPDSGSHKPVLNMSQGETALRIVRVIKGETFC